MRRGRWQNIQQTEHIHLYRPTKISTDISIDYRPTLDRYIERLSSDYRPSVDRPSTECWPITDRYVGQVSTKYRRSVGEKSAKCRWTKSYIGRDTSGTTIDRVSTDYRPLYRPTIDRVSNDYRPTVDRRSTHCRPLYRPLYRPIDQSTLPTVNMICRDRDTLLDLHNSS